MATTARPSGVPKDDKLLPHINFVFEPLTTDPSGGGLVEGRVWENTTGTKTVKAYINGGIVTFATTGTTLTEEQVEDFIAAMFAAGTQSGITVTYTDNGAAAGTLSLTVTDAPLLQGQNGAYYLDRGHHTGTQTVSSLSDFTTAVGSLITTAINALVASAPGLLDTLDELAAALGDDPNFATTVATNIATKVTKLTPATITAGGTTTTITTTSRDCGCTVRFNDGDFEDVDAIVERPTTTSMLVRISVQTRDVRVIPWQA